MPMKLVVVESPSKSHTIGNILGKDYLVIASKGHIRDLSNSGKGGLGVDVENNFKPDWVITNYPSVKTIKESARKCDEVILASDPDREGEAIACSIAEVLGIDPAKAKRVVFHEITRPVIEEAFANPTGIDMNLVASQEARRITDRIIGYKLSKITQKKIGSPSAGRVQSATLKMIVDDDEKRKAFVPESYWDIEIKVSINNKEYDLVAAKINGKKVDIRKEEDAKAILASLGDKLVATSIEKRVKKLKPKPALNTSSMQQEAFSRYKFSATKTQAVAQKLYEGLEINGERIGLITYLRTVSSNISKNFYEKHAKPFILEKWDESYLSKSSIGRGTNFHNDAHEAIRPTGTHRTPSYVAKFVSSDEAKLYRLIYERAMASLMADASKEITTVCLKSGNVEFDLNSSKTLFPGFLAVSKLDDDEIKEDENISSIKEGDSFEIIEKKSEGKQTQPPAQMSQAKVVKLMEEKGIGRPSTYASTIKNLEESGYIISKAGLVTPTPLGIKTVKYLEENAPEIVASSYTADFENKLDIIEKGEGNALDMLNNFYDHFTKILKDMGDVKTGRICPKCGGELIEKHSKHGKFIGCSNYPKCDYIESSDEPKEIPEEVGRNCPDCGAPLIYKLNKRGEKFIGCSNYPKCKHVESLKPKKEKKEVPSSAWVKVCPRCGVGHLIVRKSKKGDFLGCTNYPKCRYVESLDKKDDADKAN